MKQTVALLCVSACSVASLVACTPKPLSAKPTAEDFLEAVEERNLDALSELVDDQDTASSILSATFEGLQAEAVNFELKDVEQSESIATADYSVTWTLPRERTLSYDASMTLTKAQDKWTVRWQPTVVHPQLGAHQHLELRPVVAQRASVVSSDGVELMAPGVQYRLLVDTSAMRSAQQAAAAIAANVEGIDAAALATELKNHSGTYSVGLYDTKPAVEAPGVRVNEESALINVNKDLAPDIMARVRTIVQDKLDGSNGWRVSVVNQEGAAYTDVEYHEATPAPAIRVGIDSQVQRAAEEAVDLRQGSEAMLVAIRPSTGEILAIAQTDAADAKGDLALSGQFPPGSVFKIITAATGVEKQGLNSGSIVPCPGTMDIYGRVVTNYNGFSLGSVPLQRAFAQSCNTTFADISTRLAEGELKQEAARFGLGLDYDIPGLSTITGTVPEGKTPLERTEAGYGQGLDLVSPFGMALVSATVAAGVRPTPVLVSGLETKVSDNPDGPAPFVLDEVRAMMRQTVASGTAAGMRAGGTIYGKTGEAEINGGSHAWFTGYRDDDIAFATLVVLGGGSTTSVNITDHFLQRLDSLRGTGAQ